MKKSTLFLVIISAIFFTSTLFLLYLNLNLNRFTTPTPVTITQQSAITPTITPPTANWKTYKDDSLKLEFKYPSTYIQNYTQENNYYSVDLLGSDYHTVGNDMGVQRRGTFFIISDNPKCTSGEIMGESLIITKDNYSIYKINGYEGPDYKSAIVRKSNGKCLSFTCSSENLCEGSVYNDFISILSTFKFTDTDVLTSDPVTVTKKYLDAYVSQDWTTVKQIISDPAFDENIAKGYGFVNYKITGSKADTNPNYYHVYVSFTDQNGVVSDKAPHSQNQLEVYLYKNTNGWHPLTWYFYQ